MRNGSRGGAYTPVSAYDSDDEPRDPLLAQRQKLRKQDEDLAVLSQSISRLGDLSLEIGKEIESQNRQLDGLDRDLEHASGTVEVLNKKVAELIKKSGGMKSFVLIVVLVIILIILLFLVIYT